ncbi:hypothetical protein [Kaistia sp. MMO-174]|uniref:hypothetical protein n=1 Tax=Kaistia sp. MMO-174 TaxID=3081256 RepID=UPI003019BEA6
MADFPGTGSEWAAAIIAKLATAAGGLAGAWVRNLFPPHKPMRQRVPEYIAGALAAVYGGPVAGPLMYETLIAIFRTFGVDVGRALSRPSVESLSGFMCGVVGLTIIEGVFVLARRWRDDPRFR